MILSKIKINYIWGTSGFLNLTNAINPLLHLTPGGITWYIFTLIKTKNIFLKIPGISSNLLFYCINKINYKYTYPLFLFILLFLTFSFVIIEKKTTIYAIPWITISIFIVYKIFLKKESNLIEKLLITIITTHAIGTFTLGKIIHFLPNYSYQILFPICIFERFFFLICSYIYFYLIMNQEKLLLVILNMIKLIYTQLIKIFLWIWIPKKQ